MDDIYYPPQGAATVEINVEAAGANVLAQVSVRLSACK